MREERTWREFSVHAIPGVSRVKFAAVREKLLSKRLILDLSRLETFLFDGIISAGHKDLAGVGDGAVELGLVKGIATRLDVARLRTRSEERKLIREIRAVSSFQEWILQACVREMNLVNNSSSGFGSQIR